MVRSARSFALRGRQLEAVEVVEDIRCPAAAAEETGWRDLRCVMMRSRGCLGVDCHRTAEGYCLCSRWQSWRDFVEWTRATFYMALAVGIDARRVSVRALETKEEA